MIQFVCNFDYKYFLHSFYVYKYIDIDIDIVQHYDISQFL